MAEMRMVDSDFGPMALQAESKLTQREIEALALRRYERGEDLSTLSHRIMTKAERLG